MKKQLLSLFLCFCMILPMIPTTALAAEESVTVPVLVDQGDSSATKVEESVAEPPADDPTAEKSKSESLGEQTPVKDTESTKAATVQIGEKITDYNRFADAWAAASEASTTEDAPAKVTLYQDVTTGTNAPASWPILVAEEKYIALDLNGYDINGGDATTNVLRIEGTLTLNDSGATARTRYGYWNEDTYSIDDSTPASTVHYDALTGGIISSNALSEETREGCVHIGFWGTFTMNGGIIAGGKRSGIYIDTNEDNGKIDTPTYGHFVMNGGTIAGNASSGVKAPRTTTGQKGDIGFRMNNGEILNNRSNYGGGVNGAIEMYGGLIAYNQAEEGGGIYNRSGRAVHINKGTISYNSAGNGGGICGDFTTILLEKDGVVSNNSARNGGGIWVEKGEYSGGIVAAGKVTYNTAENYGGGIYSCGKVEDRLNGTAEVSYNGADCGGGIYLIITHGWYPTPIEGDEGSTVSHNKAKTNGGGIYLRGGENMSPCDPDINVSYNEAVQNGGGWYITEIGARVRLDGAVSYNKAGEKGGGVYVGECISNDYANTQGSVDCGEVSHNSASVGGGVYVGQSAILESWGVITNNTATKCGGGVANEGNTKQIYAIKDNTADVGAHDFYNMDGGVFSLQSKYDWVKDEPNNRYSHENYIPYTVVEKDNTVQYLTLGDPFTVKFDTKGGTPSTISDQTVKYGQKAYKPTDPRKTDCKFDGWYTSPDYTQKWDFANDSVTKDITLYAKWIEKVTLLCDFQGGTGGSEETSYTTKAFPNGRVDLPDEDDVSREGYKLLGWNENPNGTGKSYASGSSITMPDHDLTLYAIWKRLDVIKVNFDAQGGQFRYIEGQPSTWKFLVERPTGDDSTYVSDCDDYERVAEESGIVKIVNGTRYRFKGWYLNPDDPKASESPGAVQLTADSPAEITFYAVWGEYIDMPFTVHYETFGVEEIPPRTIMESALENGGKLEEVPAPPAGSGITEWKWTVNLVELLMNSPKPEMQKQAKELLQYVTDQQAAINQAYNNGEITEEERNKSIAELQNEAEAFHCPVSYTPQDREMSFEELLLGYVKASGQNEVTVYAWNKANQYPVIYDANGGKNAPDMESYQFNALVNIADGVPERDGYQFIGWNTKADGSGVSYTKDDTFYMPCYMVTLYAQWEKKETYSVTYTDGVDGKVIFEDQVYSDLQHGEKTPAFNGTPTRSGYTFKGWLPEVSATVTETVTYVAQWEKKETYSVTYTDGVDGKVIFEDQVYSDLQHGEKTPAFNGTPTRSGYTFKGWLPEVSATVTETVTYVAQWEKRITGGGSLGTKYKLHYESNGGTTYPDEYYTYGTVVTLDKVPTRTSYVFTGWYADKELTQKITSVTMTSDKTVYAGWEATGVPGMLNGDDHYAYVIGYSDGNVRPNANVSRAETATIFFRLLKAEVRDGNLTAENAFTDVSSGEWYNKAVSTMAKLGVIKGRSAETFAPSAPITRAEFAAICARFDAHQGGGSGSFSDISGHWAEKEIERAVALGWITGYPDGTFRPDAYITRAEAMTMINRVLCRMPQSEDDLLDSMVVWPDNKPTDWHYLAVQEATNSHDFKRKGEVGEKWTKLTSAPDWTKYQ